MAPDAGYGTAPEKQAAVAATHLKSGPGELNLANFAAEEWQTGEQLNATLMSQLAEREPVLNVHAASGDWRLAHGCQHARNGSHGRVTGPRA